jgi:hypothetical protein
VDNATIKALARAFRWRKLLETGAYGTIEELAAAEKINSSYVSRILRLTLLAPATVEQILAGHLHPRVTLFKIMQPFPSAWDQQLAELSRGIHLSRQSRNPMHSASFAVKLADRVS